MISDEVIVKYLAGEAEPHEATIIEQWRQSDTENEKYFQQYALIWDKSVAVKANNEVNVDLAWNILQERINKSAKKKGHIFSINNKWLMAASFALLLGIGAFILTRDNKLAEVMLTAKATNESKRLVLGDGSKIIVKNGLFSYPKSFNGEYRKVIMNNGKAFFEIAKNKEKPFVIEANNTIITVVGTEFEIISETEFTQVLVKEGKVKFNTPSGEILLTAGMGARYTKKTNLLENIHSGNNNSFGYASGQLTFANQKLGQVINDLNAYYDNVSIELDNETLANCRITASFDHDSLETVLEVISVTLNLEIEHQQGTRRILIKGKGCYQ